MAEELNKELRTLEKDLKINKYKLDDECLEQAGLFHYWADELATAKAESYRADDQLKLVLATQELKIRKDVDEGVIKIKVTDSAVKSMLEVDGIVLKARQKARLAAEVVFHLEAAVKALEHRKNELDNLTQLWIKGYYARPDGGPRRESPSDEAGRDVRGALNSRATKARKGD